LDESNMLTTSLAAIGTAAWGGHGGWGIGPFFLLIPLFWIVVLALIFTFVGRRWRRGAMYRGYGPGWGQAPWASGGTQAAEKTLAERFARGDIDEVEYRARLEVLRANRPDRPEAP
jgi:putative membrane protein